ncbi:MAG: hypothetical protein ABI068_00270 [Ktedonobacterales bacterium]
MLTYARSLAQSNGRPYPHTPLPPGTPGYIVAGLRVSPEGGEAMEQSLEDCEHIAADENADEYQW